MSNEGGLKQRACPNMRSCWNIGWGNFSLKQSDKGQLMRVICMWLILGIRTAMTVVGIIWDAIHAHVVSVIVYAIIGVLGFFFIAWCLSIIGTAQGKRKALGMMIGRIHFDIFLGLMALIHLAILIGFFFGHWIVGFGILWIVLWLLIFGVAWIARWPPQGESGSYV